MSRIGKSPIPVPAGVEVTIAPESIKVKGPLGTAAQAVTGGVSVVREGDQLLVQVVEETRQARAMSGTLRALLANMVTGVTRGFERAIAPRPRVTSST
jgi:large subunit ribosomal protein L6